jgi:hypothetical protein
MSGINSGKFAEMISRNSTREILLNMFDRSKKTAARVGGSARGVGADDVVRRLLDRLACCFHVTFIHHC